MGNQLGIQARSRSTTDLIHASGGSRQGIMKYGLQGLNCRNACRLWIYTLMICIWGLCFENEFEGGIFKPVWF